MLATARVWIISDKGRAILVRALLDPCSTCSFISKDLSKLLNTKCILVSASLTVLGGVSTGRATSAMEIGISPELNSKSIFKTNALIIPKVTDYIPESQLNLENCPHLFGLSLADNLFNDDPIHLLIGAELYSSLILDGTKKGKPDQPIAINSVFGWVLSGKLPDTKWNNDSDIQIHLCISNENLNTSIQKFWEVKEIPYKNIVSLEDELCEEHFRITHSRISDGRYKVQLPFDTEKPINIGSTRQHNRTGPKLQNDLCMVLLNWRTFKFVFIADIAQMYRQILIHESDLNYQRILWRYSPEDPISEYQLLTVTYGTCPAPFLAFRVLKQLNEDEGFAFPFASFIRTSKMGQ